MILRLTSACFLIWALLTAGTAAAFDVPGWVFKSDRFDEARAMAGREKKCLILVFSNTKLSDAEKLTRTCLLRVKSMGVEEYRTPLAEFEPIYSEYARYLEIRNRKPEPWTSPEGKKITGVLLSLREKEVTLRLADGKEQTFSVTRLSPESLKRAKEIEGIE